MKKDELERLFDEAFSNAVEKMPPPHIPSHKDAWNQVQHKIRRMQRQRAVRRSVARVGMLAASLILGAMLFGNPGVSTAFTPFYVTVKELPNHMVSFFFGNKDNPSMEAKTPPPSPSATTPAKHDSEVETVALGPHHTTDQLAFAPPVIRFIPDRYELVETDLNVISDEDQAKQIFFTYTNNRQETLRIFVSQLEDDTTIGSGAVQDEQMEMLHIDGGTAYFTVTQDGTNKLEVLKANLYVYIIGDIAKDEMVKVAEGITPAN
ncbi:DUF4367 domain-containing protein [Paenibacillus macerans]|uniref:DUF4367 domain-containing protein n=1 Tax=Paenibacillus macerans TaxID=44252 RepID=UPI003D321A63